MNCVLPPKPCWVPFDKLRAGGAGYYIDYRLLIIGFEIFHFVQKDVFIDNWQVRVYNFGR